MKPSNRHQLQERLVELFAPGIDAAQIAASERDELAAQIADLMEDGDEILDYFGEPLDADAIAGELLDWAARQIETED